MYDATNESHEFFEANRAEAVAKACDFFRASEDELAIYELDWKPFDAIARPISRSIAWRDLR